MTTAAPTSVRRELKPAAFVHLDPGQRFPRLSVRTSDGGRSQLFGPFLRQEDAEEARDFVNGRFRLRPCDYVFEPDPGLALGLGCLYAQTRACAAPCLSRVTEDDYRALAQEAAAVLATPGGLAGALPAWVGRVEDSRGLVAERDGETVTIYPVRRWCVLEEGAVRVPASRVEEAMSGLAWPDVPAARDDLSWLVAWLRKPGAGFYLDATASSDTLAARWREIIGDNP
jgi:hypothetical protein